MKKAIIAVVIVIFILAGIGIGVFLNLGGYPLYSLAEFARAIRQRDSIKLENYADLDSLIGSAVDQVFLIDLANQKEVDASSQSDEDSSVRTPPIREVVTAYADFSQFREALIFVVKDRIFDILDNGTSPQDLFFSNSDRADLMNNFPDLVELVEAIEERAIKFESLGTAHSVGNEASIPVMFRHQFYGIIFPLTFKLVKANGVWKVTELRGVGQAMYLINQMKELIDTQ